MVAPKTINDVFAVRDGPGLTDHRTDSQASTTELPWAMAKRGQPTAGFLPAAE